jgi:hypothetical protein
MGEARKERLKNAKMVNSHRFGPILKARIANLAWIIVRIVETDRMRCYYRDRRIQGNRS